jgi:hypothetical protein
VGVEIAVEVEIAVVETEEGVEADQVGPVVVTGVEVVEIAVEIAVEVPEVIRNQLVNNREVEEAPEEASGEASAGGLKDHRRGSPSEEALNGVALREVKGAAKGAANEPLNRSELPQEAEVRPVVVVALDVRDISHL